ncbi:hypothetical protein ABZ801_00005 [Actinomadura sp. NPDC047616]|uniref:hypothetical protein n=1 Tax=Actinomadura sp. NPDC047616 TaxID=3155914 RepID=UPI0033D0CACF
MASDLRTVFNGGKTLTLVGTGRAAAPRGLLAGTSCVGSFPAGARENDAYGLGRPGDGVLVRDELVRAERLPAPYAEGRALLEALGG